MRRRPSPPPQPCGHDDVDDDAAELEMPPPPPPPRRIRPVLTLAAVDVALSYCDLRTVYAAMRVCSHWYARCHVPSIWEHFALASSGASANPSVGRLSNSRTPSLRAMPSTKLQGCDVDTIKSFAKRAVIETATAGASRRHQSAALSVVDHVVTPAPSSGSLLGGASLSHSAPFSSAIQERANLNQAAAESEQHKGQRRVAPWTAPLKAIDVEIDEAARDFFRGARRLHPLQRQSQAAESSPDVNSIASVQLEWLEVENTILQGRSARIAVCSADLLTAAAEGRERLQSVLDAANEQAREVALLDDACLLWSEAAAEQSRHRESERAHQAFCANARALLKAFEAAVVRSLLVAYYSADVVSETVDAKRHSAVVPPHLTTFVELETYVISGPQMFSSTLGLQWARLKRMLPVDDVYFNLKDAVLDEMCCDHLMRAAPSGMDTSDSSTTTTTTIESESGKEAQQLRWRQVQRIVAHYRLCQQAAAAKTHAVIEPKELFSLMV
jgi:hypothetical protein